MGLVFHTAARLVGRFTFTQTMRPLVLHGHRGKLPGPLIIACTHVSHVEPMLLTAMLNRRIEWMARVEFYRNPILARTLDALEAFRVNRQGVSVSAIRHAIRRLQRKRAIGIFPEGGVARGSESMCRGGAMKGGACLISLRSGAPILPVVILGTEKLNQIDPWLPMRRGKVWINFGKLIRPDVQNPPRNQRREARKLLAKKLQDEFVRAYEELRAAGAPESEDSVREMR